jgi:hypothetical protein
MEPNDFQFSGAAAALTTTSENHSFTVFLPSELTNHG